MTHSALLEHHLDALSQASSEFPVLDLACGSGRNGLFLTARGIPVVFADIREEMLQQVAQHPEINNGKLWQVDLEAADSNPLTGRQFSSILVFRYLHRPLFPDIKSAVCPGGLVIYETFTVGQAKLGRPKNPDFLLNPGELKSNFQDWQVLHHFEGMARSAITGKKQAVARIVVRKPGCVTRGLSAPAE